MDIVLVHGFRGSHEGLMGVARELVKIYACGDIIKQSICDDGGDSDGENSRGEIMRGDVRGDGVRDGEKYSSGEIMRGDVREDGEEYSSGEIKVEPIGGGYEGVKMHYACGDIFVLDIPPFGKAGELKRQSGGEVRESKNKWREGRIGEWGGEGVAERGEGMNEQKEDVNERGESVNERGEGRAVERTVKARRVNKYFPEEYADFMAEFIRRNGLERPVLVGHSMGSLVVAATVWRYPELVNKKVVLLAPISRRTNKFFTQLQPLATKLPNKMLGYLTTQFLYVPKRWVGREVAQGWADKVRKNSGGSDARLYHQMNNGGVGELDTWQRYRETLKLTYQSGAKYASEVGVAAAAKFSTSYEVGDFPLGKEVLMLAGEKDRLIPRRQTEEVARELGYRVEFISGAGHLLNYEKPTEVAQAIKRFLD